MKRTSTTAILAIILWATTILAPTAPARGDRSQTADTTHSLDDGGLKDLLAGLGYEPKPLKKGYLITVKQSSWTYYVQLVLSNDGSKLGMNANLGSVSEPDQVSATDWKTLLVKNGDIDPSAFYFDSEQKKLYLHRTMDNRAITPVIVRSQIDSFIANIKDTSDCWKFVK